MNACNLTLNKVLEALKKYETLTIPERRVIDKWLRDNIPVLLTDIDFLKQLLYKLTR